MGKYSKEGPKFPDRYAKEALARGIRRFDQIINTKSHTSEQESRRKILEQRESRGERPLVSVYEPSGSGSGVFGIIDTSGDLAFIFERKGRFGIQRSIMDMREVGNPLPISSRMISAEDVERLIWFMALPSDGRSPLSDAVLEVNRTEKEIIDSLGITSSENIPLAS